MPGKHHRRQASGLLGPFARIVTDIDDGARRHALPDLGHTLADADNVLVGKLRITTRIPSAGSKMNDRAHGTLPLLIVRQHVSHYR